MLIGMLPDGSDPLGQRNTYRGIDIGDSEAVTITSNYIGYNGRDGIRASGAGASIEITYNEIFENGWNNNFSDGIHLDGMFGTVQYNLIRDNTNSSTTPQRGSGGGVELGPQFSGSGVVTVEDNTIRGNLSAGVSMRTGASGNTIALNSITDNDVGVSVNDEASGETYGNTISLNQMASNAALGIDLNDGLTSPDFDGVTLNDYNDIDTGSNDLMNFPVLYNALASGSDIIVTGEARTGATIEFFRTADDDSGYGEGDVYLGTFVEGDPGEDSNTYEGSVDDTAEAFTFVIPDGGTIPGDSITATATDASGNTSEFAENIIAEPEFSLAYEYRQQITVSAGSVPVDAGYSIPLTFDHASLVDADPSQSLASGDDVRVYYWDGGSWIELDRILDPLSSWNDPQTKIWFALQNPIDPGSSDGLYFLYYGDPLAVDPPADWAAVFPTGDDFNDVALTTKLNTSVAGTTTITESGGVASIADGGQPEDAGIILNDAALPTDVQFTVQHQVKLVSGLPGSEAEMLAIVQDSSQSTVADSSTENSRRRIVAYEQDDGDAYISYVDPLDQQWYWYADAWSLVPDLWGTVTVDTPAIYDLFSDGASWWIVVRDGTGAVLTTTATAPVPWSSVKNPGPDDLWLYWGEVYTDQFWASTESDWFYLRNFVDPEPTAVLGVQVTPP
jgi:parallel beta-helix repeat protein